MLSAMEIRRQVSIRILPTLFILLSLAACSPQSSQSGSQQTGRASAASGPNQAAGIQWTVPPDWVIETGRPMRVGTYRIAAAPGDLVDAECAVYFFASGQGGTVEENLQRWENEFPQPEGSTAASASKRSDLMIAGLKVHTISVTGMFMAAARPPQGGEQPVPDIRMLGAIVEAPQGLVLFKLTGPINTVSAAEPAFNYMINSVHSQ